MAEKAILWLQLPENSVRQSAMSLSLAQAKRSCNSLAGASCEKIRAITKALDSARLEDHQFFDSFAIV